MDNNTRDELRHLLSSSGTMAGLCITGITLFSTMRRTTGATVVDDIFALSALFFLLCTYCVFWALRTKHQRTVQLLTRIAEGLFAVALTAMVSAGFIMTYTLW